jgi:hypothetical protein
MGSTEDKIVEYHVSRLKSKRPDVLLGSIAELEALGSHAKAALEALKACYEEADDEEVREAARRAGYNIFMASKKTGQL